MSLFPLQCSVQHYPWGSTESIPLLLGREADGQPWAELWMGAHPRGECRLPEGGTLSAFLEARGQSLPYLFKILAAARPLSIQCHPNKQQAEEGFAREEDAGIPIDAANRNYRDRNHKPELIVALESFWALKGFRRPSEIERLFAMAGLRFLERELAEGLESFFRGLMSLEGEAKEALLAQLARGCDALPADEAHWTREFLRLYPGDIGCAAALFLQLVELEAGQGLYLDAGELHAYLRGTGLEIMANSDNVLRGGLTGKHVDTAELLRVLRFEHQELAIVEADDEGIFHTPSSAFELRRLPASGTQSLVGRGNSILLCLGGSGEIRSGQQQAQLEAGTVLFCTGDTGTLQLSGDARLWMASEAPQPC